MTIRSFNANEVIYRKGDAGTTAFVLLSGEVEIDRAGQRRLVHPGELFGESGLIQAKPQPETATAKSTISVQVLSEPQVEALIHDSPPVIQKMFKNIARQAPVEMEKPVPVARPQTPADTNGKTPPASAAAAASLTEGVAGALEKLDRLTQLMEVRSDGIEEKIRQLLGLGGMEESLEEAPVDIDMDFTDFGPLMPLLQDDTINDVLINGAHNVYIERDGLLEKTEVVFKDDKEVLAIAEKIVKCVGRKIDPNRPLVDARLLDGSRVNIIAPPLAVDGTTISIRKFSKKKITLDVMKAQKNTSAALAEFLKVAGRCRLNIIISGGTGSGKTTLLNAMSQHIDKSERIVTIEDAAELQLQQPHVIRLETRPHHLGMRPGEEVSMRELVRNALRMRPDRIIVGEVRGPEAFDMMQAMNTGHEGSLTTIHANHPRDALSRLENMISMADLQIPMKSLRYQIAAALHVIVQISRMRDGHRRVTHVSEIVGMEGDMITMHDLFNYVYSGEDDKGKLVGEFKWSGIMPRFVRRIAYYGELQRLEDAFGVKLPKNF